MTRTLTLQDGTALRENAAEASLSGLRRAALDAARLIPPLWPLKDFVAVNPALGLTDRPFEEASEQLAHTGRTTLLRGGETLRHLLGTEDDASEAVREAIHHHGQEGSWTPDQVQAALSGKPSPLTGFPTCADMAARQGAADWPAIVTDLFSAWAAGHFDQGQAAWPDPFRHMRPFASWRAQASRDRSAGILGLTALRRTAAALPDEPTSVLEEITSRLGVPPELCRDYFHTLLMSVAGWSGYVRYLGWKEELEGHEPEGLVDLLAVRAAYDLALFETFLTEAVPLPWTEGAREAGAVRPSAEAAGLAQTALELSGQNRVLRAMGAARKKSGAQAKECPAAQAVFCIDVRSERLRRAAEAVDGGIGTLGFAGFFGFAIALDRCGPGGSSDQCPVLLKPAQRVEERPAPSSGDALDPGAAGLLKSAWKRFKLGAVSSFAFVESWAPVFGWKIARDVSRHPARTAPPLGELVHAMPLEEQVATAEGAIAGMSLGADMARLVALVGHGSTTTNNPYASGLDCGACGGHTGEANARIAAKVLNDPDVRARLRETGTVVPDDTVFLAALHDTTTDALTFFGTGDLPATHRDDLERLENGFRTAGALVRAERAPGLGVDPKQPCAAILGRSRDWSEVRPEWGLAGCSSFIAAPRERTRGVDLGGRAFLHSYDWKRDPDNAVLELIMTAPVVVASWINLQYYASTVDNRAFGSGDKTLHNVVGGLGVLEGYGGDLRPGLPFQSVHDGARLVHDPLRLSVIIEAPTERIDAVLRRHPSVAELFGNGWLHLVAITGDAGRFERRSRAGDWRPVDIGPAGQEQAT